MPCDHGTFESRVLVRPVPEPDPTRPTPGRYEVVLQVRCVECSMPLVFELPVVGAQIGYIPAVSMSSDGQEAHLGAHLVAPVLSQQAAVPWQAVPAMPEAEDEDVEADDRGGG